MPSCESTIDSTFSSSALAALSGSLNKAPGSAGVSVILLFDVLCFPLFDGRIGEFGKSAPDATQHAVVLAAVKDAARR